jgi:hypothetical protein
MDNLIILSHFTTWWDVINLHLYGSLSDISFPHPVCSFTVLLSIPSSPSGSAQSKDQTMAEKVSAWMDMELDWLWISPFGFFFFLCAAGHCFCPHVPRQYPSSRPISIISVAYSSLSENMFLFFRFLSMNHDSFLISKRGRWMIKLLLCVCAVNYYCRSQQWWSGLILNVRNAARRSRKCCVKSLVSLSFSLYPCNLVCVV